MEMTETTDAACSATCPERVASPGGVPSGGGRRRIDVSASPDHTRRSRASCSPTTQTRHLDAANGIHDGADLARWAVPAALLAVHR
jgi:hypothetical protein